MPNQVPLGFRQIPERIGFACDLLHAIFAKHTNAGIVSFTDAIGGDSLGDCHQSDFLRIAVRSLRGKVNSFGYVRDVLGYGHECSKPPALRSTKEGSLAVPLCSFVAFEVRNTFT